MVEINKAYLNDDTEVRTLGTFLLKGDTEAEINRIRDAFSGSGTPYGKDGKWYVDICVSDINDLLTRIGNRTL